MGIIERNKLIVEKTDEEIKKEFGVKLKLLLKQSNTSQVELVKNLGFNKTSVNNWVQGYDQPQFLQLRKIIIYLLKKIELQDFYPIQLLVPELTTNMSSKEEKEIIDFKNEIKEEYNKKCQEIELLRKEITNLKSKLNQRRMYYEKKVKELDRDKDTLCKKRNNLYEEQAEFKKEKENYKKEVREEEILKINIEKLVELKLFPNKLVERILDSRKISELINKISVSNEIIYDDVLKRLKDTIISAILNETHYYLR